MAYTFVSYSRKQLYFAEAITLHLQKQGIEAWFDLQQLGAGADWASTLKAGYGNCERLVFVVSQSALASPYVEIEWDTALKNRREVILAVVEDVDLPEKLRGCPTIDFRSNFNGAMKRLVSYLTGKLPAPKDRISGPGKFPFPLRMPAPIWITLLALILPYVWLLGAILVPLNIVWMNGQIALAISLIALLLGPVVFWVGTRRFWNHTLDYQGLRNLTMLTLFVELVASILLMHTPLFLPAVLTGLLLLYFYVWILNRSGALLRWFSAGQVPQKVRRRIHASLMKKGAALDREELPFQPVNFALHYEPGDKPMATRVSSVLRQAGHCEVQDLTQAQRHLYIITNRTSRAMMEQAGQSMKDDTIFLLGTSVDWSNSLANAGKTQFVDIRDHDASDLKMLANSLSNMDAWRRHYALEATPKKFEVFDAPNGVQIYRFFSCMQVGAFIATGLLAFLQGSPFVAVLALLFGAALFMFAERALQRKFAFTIVMGVLAVFVLALAALERQPANLTATLLFGLVIYRGTGIWFPAAAPVPGDALGMDATNANKRLGWILAAVFVAVQLFMKGVVSAIGA